MLVQAVKKDEFKSNFVDEFHRYTRKLSKKRQEQREIIMENLIKNRNNKVDQLRSDNIGGIDDQKVKNKMNKASIISLNRSIKREQYNTELTPTHVANPNIVPKTFITHSVSATMLPKISNKRYEYSLFFN